MRKPDREAGDNTDGSGNGRHGGIQSVERAITLLKCFSRREPELTVTALAGRLHLAKSTVSRLLATLAREGLVQQDAHTSRYRLGFGLVEMAGVVLDSLSLPDVAHPHLVELATDCQETVNLSVIEGGEVVNTDRVAGQHSIAHQGWVWRRMPVYCTAAGKALLAFQPEEAILAALPMPLRAMTPHTITDPQLFLQELAEVKRRGYAVLKEELELGVGAIGAPVRNHEGRVVAAVVISVPAFRFSPERQAAYAGLVVSTAAKVSRALGFHGCGEEPGAPTTRTPRHQDTMAVQ